MQRYGFTEPVNKSNDDVFDVHILVHVCTRVKKTVQCLQMILVRKHLCTAATHTNTFALTVSAATIFVNGK